MEKKSIAILFGGHSTEHEISLQSACAVAVHLDRERYEPVLVGITREGEWYLYRGPLELIARDEWRSGSCVRAVLSPCRSHHGLLVLGEGAAPQVVRLDAAFPVLHGRFGEDGTVQGLLELAGIPIVGCDTLSSAVCMDKAAAHTLAAAAGVQVPRSAVLYGYEGPDEVQRKLEGFEYPLFVKPARAGSSFGITRVTHPDDLPLAIERAFGHDGKVVVEQAVPGFEVGCAVMGTQTLVIGEVDEIELSHGFFDYTEKYTLKTSKIHMPARISPEAAQRIKHTAAVLYRALGCSGFARVDMFLTPEGEVVFNEANTIPGFTAHSRFPNMMKGAGFGFAEVVGRLVEGALEQ